MQIIAVITALRARMYENTQSINTRHYLPSTPPRGASSGQKCAFFKYWLLFLQYVVTALLSHSFEAVSKKFLKTLQSSW